MTKYISTTLVLLFLSFGSLVEVDIRRCQRLYGHQFCKLQFARQRRSGFDSLISEKVSRPVGDKCSANQDCVAGAFCDAGSCRCFGTHIVIHEHCWKKISPEESGCTYDEQCESVWPGSRCDFSVCRCPEGQVISRTREGPVCHFPGRCPTNGAYSMLYNRNSNHKSECFFFEKEDQGIPGHFIGCDDFPEMYDCIRGICCPTKALTCIQPMDPGQPKSELAALASNVTTLESEKRWFFNPITESCVQFDYLGCPRGQPRLDRHEIVPVSCNSQSDCDSEEYFCTKVSHVSLCCPTPEFICSAYGGISSDTTILPHSVGSNRFGAKSQIRWYWNKDLRKCKTFRYLGQGGNFNNFPTEQSCLEFCSKSLCPFGTPLLLDSGSTANCTNNQQCPRTHYCSQSVCCPTPTTICNEPLSLGVSCQAESVPRYWFNSAFRICQLFSYSGCGGNDNKFTNMDDCQTFCDRIEEIPKCPRGEPLKVDASTYWKCVPGDTLGRPGSQCPSNHECFYDGKISACCPKKEFTCNQPSDSGRKCNLGSVHRWYYDAKSRNCKIFEFFGCDGNSNNFEDQRSCEEYCRAYSCPFGGEIYKKANDEPVTCNVANSTKSSECPKTHICTPLLNADESTDLDQTHYCCPTRQTVCLNQPIDEGLPCAEPRVRYGFDVALKTCIPFKYAGCAGNANNFHNYQNCIHFCMSAACAPGEVVYQSTKNESIFDCTKQACPLGYVCVADVINPEKSVCCGSLNTGVCPADQGAYIEERFKKPKTCHGDGSRGCPSGYSCIFSKERKQYYCCTPQSYKKPECPIGLMPAENKEANSHMGCNSDSQCPPSSKCYFGGKQHQSGVCCLQGSPCPPLFALDIEKSQEGECNPLEPTSCSSNRSSICLFSEVMERFVCCKREPRHPTDLTTCPGKMVRDSKRRICSSHGNCPSNYSCIRRNYERVGICCRHKKIPQISVRKKPSLTQCQINEDSCCSTSVVPYRKKTSETCRIVKCPTGYICINERFCCPDHVFIKPELGLLCGDYWKPVLNESRDFPILCNPTTDVCEQGQACRFSSILRIHICCRPLFGLQSYNNSYFGNINV